MITFFISSTFKDMQAERDALHEMVFPQLRQILAEYGENTQELDLRWGVDTMNLSEEESGHQVLKVCIDAIDRCHPYIIVLLGERYGWVPDNSIVESLHDERILNVYKENTSITNLEIQYGALSEEETLTKCVFCFRDPHVLDEIDADHKDNYRAESAFHRNRLEQVKRLIRSKENAVIIDYDAHWDNSIKKIVGLEGFCEDLLQALKMILADNLTERKIPNGFQRLNSKMRLVQDRYMANYVTRYDEEAELLERIQLFNKNRSSLFEKQKAETFEMVHIVSAPGSGKSAVMASVERYLRENGCYTILYFGGAAGASGYSGLKEYVISALEKICNAEKNDADTFNDRMNRLSATIKDKEIYCFIDGMDQIFSSEEKSSSFDLPILCPYLFYVVSSASGTFDGITRKQLNIKLHNISIDQFNFEQKREMILRTSAQRGKKPDEHIIDLMVKKEGFDVPIFLSILMQRLFMMDSREFEQAEAIAPGMLGLHKYMERLIGDIPENASELISCLFSVTSERFSLKQYRDVLILLAVSDYGLSDKELSDLFVLDGKRFQQLSFQQMVCYLYDVFTLYDDAKWTFTHRLYKEYILDSLTEQEYTWAEGILIKYSFAQPEFMRQEGYRYILKSGMPEAIDVIIDSPEWENAAAVREFLIKCIADDPEKYRFLCEYASQTDNYEYARFFLLMMDSCQSKKADMFFNEILLALTENQNYTPLECAEIRHKAALHLNKTKDERLTERFFVKSLDNASKLSKPYREIYTANVYRVLLKYHNKSNRKEMLQSVAKELYKSIDKLGIVLADSEKTQDSGEYLKGLQTYAHSVIDYSWYLYYCEKDSAPELLKNCLDLLTDYTDSTGSSAVVDITIGIYSYLVKCYASKRYRNNDLIKKYGKSGISYCEKHLESSPLGEGLNYAVDLYCAFAQLYKMPWRYEYLEKALIMSRKLYNIQPTEYSKEMVAWTACMLSESAALALKERANDRSIKIHRDDPERFRIEGQSLYEELYNSSKDPWLLYTYINSNLVFAERLMAEEAYDKAMQFTDNAVRLAPKIGSDNNMNELLRDVFLAAAQINHALSENEKALTFINESLRYAEIVNPDKQTVSRYEADALLYRCRILFRLNQKEELLEACGKALSYNRLYKKRDNQTVIRRELEIICIMLLCQISLDRTDQARALFNEIPAEYADYAENQTESPDRTCRLYILCKGEIYFLFGQYDKASDLYRKCLNAWHSELRRIKDTLDDQTNLPIHNNDAGKYREGMYFEVYCRIRLACITDDYNDVLSCFSDGSWQKSKDHIMQKHLSNADELFSKSERSIIDWYYVVSIMPEYWNLADLLPEEYRSMIFDSPIINQTADRNEEERTSAIGLAKLLAADYTLDDEASMMDALYIIRKLVASGDDRIYDNYDPSAILNMLKKLDRQIELCLHTINILYNRLYYLTLQYYQRSHFKYSDLQSVLALSSAQKTLNDHETVREKYWQPMMSVCLSIRRESLTQGEQQELSDLAEKYFSRSGYFFGKAIPIEDKNFDHIYCNKPTQKMSLMTTDALQFFFDCKLRKVRNSKSKYFSLFDPWTCGYLAIEILCRTGREDLLFDLLGYVISLCVRCCAQNNYSSIRDKTLIEMTYFVLFFLKEVSESGQEKIIDRVIGFVMAHADNLIIVSLKENKELFSQLIIQIFRCRPDDAIKIETEVLKRQSVNRWLFFRQKLMPVEDKIVLTEHRKIQGAKRFGDWQYKIVNDRLLLTGYSGVASFLTIPSAIDGVKVYQISKYMLSECSFVTEIEISEGIICIEEGAFWRCKSLARVSFPKSLNWIGNGAFKECINLEIFVLPNRETRIGKIMFTGFSKLRSVTLPCTVKIIYEYQFKSCSSLTDITIPSSVELIAKCAFEDCDQLKAIYYEGSELQWNDIKIDFYGNTALKTAKIYFNRIADDLV